MSLTFDFIGIVTRDLAASLDFYRALGLDIGEGQEQEPHVEVTLPSGVRIGWDPIETIHSFDPGYEFPTGDHRVAFAFQAASPAEVNEVHARLVAAGHASRVDPWDAPWGQRYSTVLDPDGNAIDIYAPLAS
ncbi:glyoxalase [Leucobacter viscericola]|uniref:Glyoxalase n=1 Tax=Leucobacter viscericola TaxID=2714935 RepID=A0A6G7XC24_9MICO|nr:VOC family protein [Leucobacter viscericola]QIK61918.1 glyoxalase [Leucobacter viscericola]